jgi:hypothetical protein
LRIVRSECRRSRECGGWEELLEPVPLGVGEIAWIEWRHAVQCRPCRPCSSLQNTLFERLLDQKRPLRQGRVDKAWLKEEDETPLSGRGAGAVSDFAKYR